MGSFLAVVADRSRGARGFVLIELLVVATMLIAVLGATLTLLELGSRAENRDQRFAVEVAAGEAGLARMVHEIRQATSVTATTPNSIDFLVSSGGRSLRVLYECDVARAGTAYNECVRLSVAAGGVLPALAGAAVVVPRMTNGTPADPVFAFSPDPIAPTYVDATLRLPAADDLSHGGLAHSTVLDSGTYLRNLDVGA